MNNAKRRTWLENACEAAISLTEAVSFSKIARF